MYDPVGFLHDIHYEVENGKVILKGLSTYVISNDMVTERLISHEDKFNEITFVAAVTIMIADGLMDLETNYMLNTIE
jgi:hypothetical protein